MKPHQNHVLIVLSLCLVLLVACVPATPVPVATETATPLPAADPAAVVQDFWDKFNAGDLEGAMALTSADVKCRGRCYFGGQDAFRGVLQGYIDGGIETFVSEIQVDGDRVSYKVEIHRNGQLIATGFADEAMIVQNGLIVLWENNRI
jgi:hypothetical protein